VAAAVARAVARHQLEEAGIRGETIDERALAGGTRAVEQKQCTRPTGGLQLRAPEARFVLHRPPYWVGAIQMNKASSSSERRRRRRSAWIAAITARTPITSAFPSRIVLTTIVETFVSRSSSRTTALLRI